MEDFQKCCLCRENNLQISVKFLGNRLQENMQEVHAEKKLDKVVLDWRCLHEIFLPILHSKWESASSPTNKTKLMYLHLYKVTVVHKLWNTNIIKQNITWWTGKYREVCAEKNEGYFHLSAHIHIQITDSGRHKIPH